MIHSSIADNTRSKNNSCLKPLERCRLIQNLKICPSHLYPYFIKDTWTVWYKDHVKKYKSKTTSFICKKGVEFEEKIVNQIKAKFISKTLPSKFSMENVRLVKKYIKKKIPVIFSASLYNPTNKTYGIADILMRNDVFEQCFNQSLIGIVNAPTQFYVVLDVKYKTLHLDKICLKIKNTPSLIANKAQLFIYNEALSLIQGFNSHMAFLVGSFYKYGTRNCKTSLEMAAPVDFYNGDKDIMEKLTDAIRWYKQYKAYGVNWSYNPPTNEHMFINMNVDSGKYQPIKKKLAENIGEISLLYKCGKREKRAATSKSWKSPSWRTESLNITSNNKKCIVDRMIYINQQNKVDILPKSLSSTTSNILKDDSHNFYVDFETFNTVCDPSKKDIPHQGFIFMIGVTHRVNNRLVHKKFCIHKISIIEEFLIMNAFVDYINLYSNNPKIVYWSAETYIWKNTSNTLFETIEDESMKNIICNKWKFGKWVDLAFILRAERIVIKGIYNYKLKNIAYQLNKYGYINIKTSTKEMNGLTAMVMAFNYFKKKSSVKIFAKIKRYNRLDCKMLYLIWQFFKTY